jgi:hypothetical protein
MLIPIDQIPIVNCHDVIMTKIKNDITASKKKIKYSLELLFEMEMLKLFKQMVTNIENRCFSREILAYLKSTHPFNNIEIKNDNSSIDDSKKKQIQFDYLNYTGGKVIISVIRGIIYLKSDYLFSRFYCNVILGISSFFIYLLLSCLGFFNKLYSILLQKNT